MSDGRGSGPTGVTLVTPIPPMRTGLSTYALRVLEGARDLADWTVAYPEGGDPDCLPSGVRAVPLERLPPGGSEGMIYNVGNSTDCFGIVAALRGRGGLVLLHEVVLHHMLRYGYLERGMLEAYREELRFEYGPGAKRVEERLSKPLPEAEYDALLKRHPLVGRTLRAARAAACLNPYALSRIRGAFPEGRTLLVGHPLSPLPDLRVPPKPFGFTLGIVGSHHPGRNLERVLGAAALLRRKAPDLGVLAVGGGYPTELPEWVLAPGRLPETEYQGWIRTMDVAVDVRHPTCGETSGSLLEVMRACIAPVVTATDAFLNLPSEAVLRVPPETGVQGLAAAVELLREDPVLRANIGAAAGVHAESEGSTERMRADWRRLIALSREPATGRNAEASSYSLSAAWHEPPPGFMRDTRTRAVSWRFSDGAVLTGPAGTASASITAWGEGTVNGVALPTVPILVEVMGRELEFRGGGWVTGVLWS